MRESIPPANYKISGTGTNTTVKIADTAVLPPSGLDIATSGDRNTLLIGKNTDIRGMSMQFYGSGNKVIIERGARIKGVFICKGDNNLIHIGHHVEFVGAFVQAEYNTEIVVGAWGIYSTGLVIRSGDSHSVVDIKSLKRINQPKSIRIADRVWAGYNVSIMKGVEIQHDTIIGASSVVTKSPGEGRCIIAGTPAKVVKRGVFWEKRSLGDNVAESFWDASLKFREIDRTAYMNDIKEPAQRDWKTVALWGAVIISLALHLLR